MLANEGVDDGGGVGQGKLVLLFLQMAYEFSFCTVSKNSVNDCFSL